MDKNKICIISEGSYPIVRGGVSEWTQQLINELHFLDFDIFCLSPTGQESWISEYEKPRNVKSVTIHGVASTMRAIFAESCVWSQSTRVMGKSLTTAAENIQATSRKESAGPMSVTKISTQLLAILPNSLRATRKREEWRMRENIDFFNIYLLAFLTRSQLTMALIPGRSPAIFSTGTACISKVFRSKSPLVLVAFQVAKSPSALR